MRTIRGQSQTAQLDLLPETYQRALEQGVRLELRLKRELAAVHASTPLTEGREVEALWGRMKSCAAIVNRRAGRFSIGPQICNLPHIKLVSSTARLEPGVFGVFRPVLWLPAGIADRLEDAELEAILAHEVCHLRRRDNLAAAIHMAVEAIFWLHPLVWWLGARLTEERERACDEEVVRMGGEPQVYAESILKVCEFYLASPVICAAGVTGGELKKRIEGIMANRFTRKMNFGKKLLLAAAAVVAVACPFLFGVVNGRAQTKMAAHALPRFEVASVRPSATAMGQLAAERIASASTSNVSQTLQSSPARAPDQPPPAAPPERRRFEVASVKPSLGMAAMTASGRDPHMIIDPVRVDMDPISLEWLIETAFKVQSYQVSGPDWLATTTVAIVAKIPDGATREQLPEMFQTLLEERFKLVARREPREQSVYALVVGKDGPKLKESAPDAGGAFPDERHPLFVTHTADGLVTYSMVNRRMVLESDRITLAELASLLRPYVDVPVLDATGLKGYYQVALEVPGGPNYGRGARGGRGMNAGRGDENAAGPPAEASDPSGGVSIFASVQKLGLALGRRTAPIEHIVVDHLEKIPTEN